MNAWSKFAAVTMAGCLSALVAGTVNAAEITVVAGGGPLPDVMGTLVPKFESATGATGNRSASRADLRSPRTSNRVPRTSSSPAPTFSRLIPGQLPGGGLAVSINLPP
jgi:hypothetical protein